MKSKERVLTLVSIGVALFLPVIAFAATGAGLVPCGTGATGATECSACDLVALIQGLLKFFIGLSIPIAVAMFAYAGVLYFTSGAMGTKNIIKAHKIFSNAFIGFVITISAWLVVNTILNVILDKSFYNEGNWFTVKCYTRLPDTTLNKVLDATLGVVTPSSSSTASPIAGKLTQLNTIAPNGTSQSLGFTTSRSDADLQNTYNQIQATYGSQIAAACQSYGSNIPNCTASVAALMTVESSGNPNGVSTAKAIGLMQTYQSSAVGGCNISDITCNINSGVNELNTNVALFGGNLPNAIAAYNGGTSSKPGSSPNGLTPAMAPSQDCPGLYAYQCTTNPGGLVETQKEVANTCRAIVLAGGSC